MQHISIDLATLLRASLLNWLLEQVNALARTSYYGISQPVPSSLESSLTLVSSKSINTVTLVVSYALALA